MRFDCISSSINQISTRMTPKVTLTDNEKIEKC